MKGKAGKRIQLDDTLMDLYHLRHALPRILAAASSRASR